MAWCCSSRSWKASIYFTMSVFLAVIAISSRHSKPQEPTTPTKVASLQLSLNASKALRRFGFNAMAILLQVSPEIFLYSSPNTTIFALQDLAISNTSLPPEILKNLLQYHTAPLNLPFDDLLEKPRGSCLPTIYKNRSLAITRLEKSERTVEINAVMVSHPDLFLSETLSIHGVVDSFSPLDPETPIQAPTCDPNSSLLLFPDFFDSSNVIPWSSIVRKLSSEGFVSFAIGLNSVLDEILAEYKGLESVTIFTPPSLSIAGPSPLLKRNVLFHILPQKLTYQELASMPVGALFMTLAPDIRAEVTATATSKRRMFVSGVEIVAPNIFTSERFAIHGISRALNIGDTKDTPNL